MPVRWRSSRPNSIIIKGPNFLQVRSHLRSSHHIPNLLLLFVLILIHLLPLPLLDDLSWCTLPTRARGMVRCRLRQMHWSLADSMLPPKTSYDINIHVLTCTFATKERRWTQHVHEAISLFSSEKPMPNTHNTTQQQQQFHLSHQELD